MPFVSPNCIMNPKIGLLVIDPARCYISHSPQVIFSLTQPWFNNSRYNVFAKKSIPQNPLVLECFRRPCPNFGQASGPHGSFRALRREATKAGWRILFWLWKALSRSLAGPEFNLPTMARWSVSWRKYEKNILKKYVFQTMVDGMMAWGNLILVQRCATQHWERFQICQDFSRWKTS